MGWNYVVTSSVPWLHETQTGNAIEVYNYFHSLGFTDESIAGLLGNMEHESYLNPGQQEIGQGGSTSRGYGLIQWTPATNLINAIGNEWWLGNKQLELINNEGSTSAWIPTTDYPYSWEEFSHLTDVHEATKAYAIERERAGVSAFEARCSYADYWYSYISDNPPSPPTPTTTGHRMPVWMMVRKF